MKITRPITAVRNKGEIGPLNNITSPQNVRRTVSIDSTFQPVHRFSPVLHSTIFVNHYLWHLAAAAVVAAAATVAAVQSDR